MLCSKLSLKPTGLQSQPLQGDIRTVGKYVLYVGVVTAANCMQTEAIYYNL